MTLPSWIGEAQAKWLEREKKLQQEAKRAVLDRPIYDSPANAPGWRDLGMEFTCVPDSQYPWDPGVVKRIWTFDPGFVPVWLRWVFQHENGEQLVFGRHALGRRANDPRKELMPFPCEMPTMPCQGITFQQPNIIERFWMDGRIDGELPGPFLPFDGTLYNFCRESYLEKSGRELKRLTIDKDKELNEKRKLALEDELAYRNRDLQRFVQKKLDLVSDSDARDHLLGDRIKSPKPFVDLGGLPA